MVRRSYSVSILALSLVALVAGSAAAAAPGLAEAAAPRTDPAERVVATAIRAALAGDVKTWLGTIHPTERATPDKQQQLEKYTFARVAKQAKWYVRGADADSFEVARREDMGGGRIKIFLKDLEHPTRAPVPIALEELPGGGFAIITMSL